MKKIIGDWSTEILVSDDEAEKICRLGQGEKCCAFLVAGSRGFECIRMSYPSNSTIFSRLEKGTMNAKGEGGWIGCGWYGEIPNSEKGNKPNDFGDRCGLCGCTEISGGATAPDRCMCCGAIDAGGTWYLDEKAVPSNWQIQEEYRKKHLNL